jgi:hypothetical protein
MKVCMCFNCLDTFTRDNILEDGKSGLFCVIDGHGGDHVARFCVDFIPDVLILQKAIKI